MKVSKTAIEGVLLVASETHFDIRGYFDDVLDLHAATLSDFRYQTAEFATFAPRQLAISHNSRAGTIRGLHYQEEAPQLKFIRCISGRIYDVALDLRAGSATYGKHVGVTLDAHKSSGLFIPRGVAHGFQALADESQVLYAIEGERIPGLESGARYNDPIFGIKWPLEPTHISDRDRAWPLRQMVEG